MDNDKILDYVRKTPANTNPNVLKTMLDDSGSEMNPGYSCTETVTLLTDESVTTVFGEVYNSGKLAYSTSIDADTIRVTFDGTEYTCNAQEGEMGTLYGAPIGEEGVDWSGYPFHILSGLGNYIYTETAGTYQIKIETVEEVIETTPCFEKAVNSVVGGGSGGSLPPITADNLGQVLGVVPDLDNVSPKEVIPEQTITIVDTEVEVTADWGPYAPDSEISAKMTFNGIEYDAFFRNNYYEAPITIDELLRYVRVRVESGTTYVNVYDSRDHKLPGDYNISFTIMAPGVKYGLISM